MNKKAMKETLKDALLMLGIVAAFSAVVISVMAFWYYTVGKGFVGIGTLGTGLLVAFGIFVHDRYKINKRDLS